MILSLAILAALNSSVAFAQNCGLPVCNVPATVQGLRTKSQGERYNQILALGRVANRSQKAAELSNIRDFARAAAAVFIELEEEKWLITAAKNLAQTCTQGLAAYSPVQADLLMGYFVDLPYEQNRYEILQHWEVKAKEMETRQELAELSRYFGEARRYCEQIEDGDYVIQVIKKAEQTLIERTFALQPIYEGVYSIQSTCEGSDRCDVLKVDRLVMVDTLGLEKLKVSFLKAASGISVFAFTGVAVGEGGTELTAISRYTGIGSLTRLELKFDVITRKLTGKIETPEFVMHFTGTPVNGSAPIEVIEAQRATPPVSPIPVAVFDTSLVGTYGGMAARLKVNVFDDDEVGATLFLGENGQYRLPFQNGRFYPKTGVLVLTSERPNMVTIKIVVSLKWTAGSGEVVAKGVSFLTTSGSFNLVEMATAR